jgi:antagonist of KipI
MPSLLVIRPGLQTTVQDLGRWGFQAQGVPVAGAMDGASHRVANALAGNDINAATLEVTLAGPELAFEDERTVAVTGADLSVTLDGRAIRMNSAILVPAGAYLTFGERRRGARSYVAIAGGIDVPPVLGSRATHPGSRMGGLHGRALAAGDRLPLATAAMGSAVSETAAAFRHQAAAATRLPDGPVRLRIVLGPQQDHFAPESIDTLRSARFTIGQASGRMALRLEGPRLRHIAGADVISDATTAGAIQVPGSGEPILLTADRQTTGGYAKIATVITADLDLCGQLAPGDTVSFEICTMRDALGALIARERVLMAIETGAAE